MILKPKHRQFFIGYSIILSVCRSREQRVFTFGTISSKDFKLIFGVTGLIYVSLYILRIGIALKGIIENRHHFRYAFEKFSILCCIAGYSLLHLDELMSASLKIPESISAYFIPLTLFVIFYLLKNVVLTFKSLEIGKRATLNDYVLNLFALPIGIWFIRCRQNNMIDALALTEYEK